ncbi:acetyltransferase [Arthrobacter sp. MMS24-S77]
MPVPLVIIGGGGFGRESIDVVEAINRTGPDPVFELLGVIDDSLTDVGLRRLTERGYKHLGSLQDWLKLHRQAHYVVAVGDPKVRRRLSLTMQADGRFEAATLTHPAAVIGSRSKIGAGTVICSGVQVSTNVKLGDHVHLNPGSIVGHDAQVGDFVSVNPGAIVSGETVVEDLCLMGAGSVLLQGLRVESGSTVGAGAVVTRHVAPMATVKGVPAR